MMGEIRMPSQRIAQTGIAPHAFLRKEIRKDRITKKIYRFGMG